MILFGCVIWVWANVGFGGKLFPRQVGGTSGH